MYIKALLAWFQAVRVWTPVFESQIFRMEPARDGGGPIKSGKSTFINALFGGDYLKRGAGVWKQPQ